MQIGALSQGHDALVDNYCQHEGRLREAAFTSPIDFPAAVLRPAIGRVEELHRPTLPLMRGHFRKTATHIASDNCSPESKGCRILGELAHLPLSREEIEEAGRDKGPHAATAILAQDKELFHVVGLSVTGEVAPIIDDREPSQLRIDPDEERVPPRLDPATSKDLIAETPILADVPPGELAEVVQIQLDEAAQDGPVPRQRVADLDAHDHHPHSLSGEHRRERPRAKHSACTFFVRHPYRYVPPSSDGVRSGGTAASSL